MRLLFLVCVGLARGADAWPLLPGVVAVPREERTYVTGQPLRPRYAASELSDELVAEAARASARVSRSRLASMGATPSAACGLGTPIELYVWHGAALPVNQLFPDRPPEDTYVGVYVPSPGLDRIAVIPSDRRETFRILVHEFAHAWYAHACVTVPLAESSEDFARAVQAEALRLWEAPPTPPTPPTPPSPPSPPTRLVASNVVVTSYVLVSAPPVVLVQAPPVVLVEAPGVVLVSSE